MPHPTPSGPDDSERPLRCSQCCGDCVWLRWSRALLLHFDRRQVGSALECLRQVMDQPSCPLFLGLDSFSASHARDGCYYLICPDNLILRLSEDDARQFRDELIAAQTTLAGGVEPGARLP